VIAFESAVRIERPLEDVFAYVSDPLNFPRWNSAVQTVRRTSVGADTDVGSTFAMERNLPSGRAVNALEIVTRERPREFAIRTTSGPTPFVYRYRFSPESDATVLELDAAVELGGAAELLRLLVRRAVQKGVDDNLATLKTILEQRSDRTRDREHRFARTASSLER